MVNGDDEYSDDDIGGIGCCNCDGGWHHGCCDDLCCGSNEAVDCDNAFPCKFCNPDGDVIL